LILVQILVQYALTYVNECWKEEAQIIKTQDFPELSIFMFS